MKTKYASPKCCIIKLGTTSIILASNEGGGGNEVYGAFPAPFGDDIPKPFTLDPFNDLHIDL